MIKTERAGIEHVTSDKRITAGSTVQIARAQDAEHRTLGEIGYLAFDLATQGPNSILC